VTEAPPAGFRPSASATPPWLHWS